MKPGKPLQRKTPITTRTALTSRTPLVTRTRLKAVSAKRAVEQRKYTRLRAAFLDAYPWCVYPAGCGQPSTEVHHKRGRVGALLLAVEHWAAMCRDHHAHVTEHPAEAYAIGISEHRIGAA